jgi:Asp-tRNA(Asn)/Glu-tRNA(Gln) amidotransferase A subunit family amidase
MSSHYNLRSLSLPRLTGWRLRAVARALEGPARGPLLRKLLADGGIAALRQRRPEEPPTPLPIRPGGERAAAGARAAMPALAAMEPAPAGRGTTVAELARGFRDGTGDPEAVAAASLERIRESDRGELPLRAFIAVDEDDVMAQARASKARFARGEPLGVLDGVPVAIKDEVDQIGYPTTVGTSFLGAAPARVDAEVVARLRAAGAVLLGKANMHEIGINPNGLNVHHGQVRNPRDPHRDPGGSSSGSAAAVAAGICPLAIGADGGGSIRIPAALCGVLGLKATFGRISERGAAPLAWSVGHLGPLGASTACVAAAYAAIAGPDPGDPTSLYQPAPTLEGWDRGDLSGVRIGVFDAWFDHADPELVAACRAAVDSLVAAGAERIAIEIPALDEMRIAHAVTILSEMATAMDNVREHRRELGPGVRASLALGRSFSATDYLTAQRIRTRAIEIFATAFAAVDLIATPATAIPAPPIIDGGRAGFSDLGTSTELMRYVVPGNFVGVPAISIPVGLTGAGLPIGLQLMADCWREPLLLAAAGILERAG